MKKKQDKKNQRRKVIGMIGLLLLVVFTWVILVPMISSILGIFVSLILIYKGLDINFKFVGGCFFLVVYWYIFTSLVSLVISGVSNCYDLIWRKKK